MRRLFSKLKKTVSICVACAVCVLSLTAVPMMKASAVNTAQTYKIYNAQTGTYISSYTLSANPVMDKSKALIGTDDRVVDFTKSGVVKIFDANDTICSGFVVDSHTIATAAHCVRNKSISRILLFNSNGENTLTATPKYYHLLSQYDQIPNSSIDYALITVEEDLSDYAFFNLGVVTNNFLSSSHSLYVTGFPVKLNNNDNQIVNDNNSHTMYTGSGNILSGDTTVIHYNADTSGGNSGGPVYITSSYNNNVYYTVIAVHTSGNPTQNSGTRITTNLLHFYKNNPNISY